MRRVQTSGMRSCAASCRHDSIRCCQDQAAALLGGVAADGLLPDSGREAADDPDARAGRSACWSSRSSVLLAEELARRLRDRGAGVSRYRPFREIPSALATASTWPWCVAQRGFDHLAFDAGERRRAACRAARRRSRWPLIGRAAGRWQRAEDLRRRSRRGQRRVRLGERDHAPQFRSAAGGRCPASGRAAAAPSFPRRRRGGPCLNSLGGAVDEVVDEAGNLVAALAQRADAPGGRR